MNRYYVDDGNGGTDLEVLCMQCADTRRQFGEFCQFAEEPDESEELECADCGYQNAQAKIWEAEMTAHLAHRERPEFPFGEFDNGGHWRGEG